MSITCARRELGAAVAKLSVATKARTSLELLRHVRVTPDGDKLHLFATDLEIGCSASVSTRSLNGTGPFTVPYDRLSQALAKFEGDDVTFKVAEEKQDKTSAAFVTLQSDRSKVKVGSLPPEDFPVPKEGRTHLFTCSGAALATALLKALPAVSTNVSSVLCGIGLRAVGGKLRMDATDAHRMHSVQLDIPCGIDGWLILPSTGAAAAIKLFRAAPEVTVELGEQNDLFFTAGDVSMFSRLIEGQYPNVDRYGSGDVKHCLGEIVCRREELIAAIERATIVQPEANRVVLTMDCTAGSLNIAAKGLTDTYTEDIEANCSVLNERDNEDGTQFGMNAAYVLNALRSLSGEGIKWYHSALQASYFLECDSPEGMVTTILAMPMNVA